MGEKSGGSSHPKRTVTTGVPGNNNVAWVTGEDPAYLMVRVRENYLGCCRPTWTAA